MKTENWERIKAMAVTACDKSDNLLQEHLDKYGEVCKPHIAAKRRTEIAEATAIIAMCDAEMAKPAREPLRYSVLSNLWSSECEKLEEIQASPLLERYGRAIERAHNIGVTK